MTITSKFIERVLFGRHQPMERWLFLTGVATNAGFVDTSKDGLKGRYIDAFAIALWPSTKFERVAYEIKVSRSDFLRELDNPTKRAAAVYLSNRFYFALAPGVLKDDDLLRPDLQACGLLEIQESGAITEYRKAVSREAWPMPETFIVSLLRNARDQVWKSQDMTSHYSV